MDERLSQSDFNESSEIPLVALYFHKPFNVDQKFKSLHTDFPKFTKTCRWEDIKNYINIANGFSEDIVNAINEYNLPDQCQECLNIFYINKKRKRNIETISTNIPSKTLGRIKNEDKNNGKSGKHNKYQPDNIIKKCKNILLG